MCTNVLIVEEEPVATALQRTLIACGFCALVVSDLAEAKKLMTTVIPDLVIFDSALSDPWDRMFGRGLAADDRTRNIPQLLLSKSDMPEAISKFRSEAIEGRVSWPVSRKKLIDRITAVLRRHEYPTADDGIVRLGMMTIDPVRRRVVLTTGASPQILRVGPIQFRLLYFLMANPDKVFNREILFDVLWQSRPVRKSWLIDSYIRRLRSELRSVDGCQMLVTVRGFGYMLCSDRLKMQRKVDSKPHVYPGSSQNA
jgi:two-component system phosphate regulon response regulator PhoB